MSTLHAVFALAIAIGLPEGQDPGSEPTVAAAAHAEWGALAAMEGRDWARLDAPDHVYRVLWREPGRVLVWQYRSPAADWADSIVFTRDPGTRVIRGELPASGNRRGVVELDADGSATLVFGGMLPSRTRYAVAGDAIEVSQSGRMIPTSTSQMVRVSDPTAALAEPPAAPRTPIIIAAAPEPAPPARSGRNARPPARPAEPPAPRPAAVPPAAVTTEPRASRPGPIVIASAPPPPAAMREGPRGAPAPTPRGAVAGSREAQMLAQVETRRVQAAREVEAERQRQAAAAEQARQAEAARRAEEAANSAAWGEAFGMVGALVGGVAAGMQTNGDMTAISAGMAAGSAIVAPESEIATATNQNFQIERERYEAQQAAEAELHARTIAAMNDPTNPLTQQQRREETTRQERAETARADTERRDREQREAEDREALLQQRMEEARTAETEDHARQERAEADQARREEQARRAAEQREREARQAREEEERRQEEQRLRRQEEERQAEARRQEQERQRAAAEAERNRVIDFKEGVVLCSLTGPQAQFNNWTCEGPLQMNYVNFERPNYAAALALTGCENARELPRAGAYRAFGCGYGIHPTNPGASRNVPEMLGVFVDGRAVFRCSRSIGTVCRTR